MSGFSHVIRKARFKRIIRGNIHVSVPLEDMLATSQTYTLTSRTAAWLCITSSVPSETAVWKPDAGATC